MMSFIAMSVVRLSLSAQPGVQLCKRRGACAATKLVVESPSAQLVCPGISSDA